MGNKRCVFKRAPMIDISRANNDLYYRYKMPRVVVKLEGKTGGQKTVIVNLADIAQSLKREPAYILKFISYELATQSKVDGSKHVVNGKHECQKIQDLVYDFIDAFVMCPACDNPETFYFDENGLGMECLACGTKSRMNPSKLNAVILRDVEKRVTVRTDSYFSTDCEDELQRLLQEDDPSEAVCRLLRDSGQSDEQIMMRLLSIDTHILRRCRVLPRLIPSKTVLASVEEAAEGSICEHLEMLEKEGLFKRSELFKYFTKPQSRKRSPELKKEINDYFSQ